MKKCIAVLGLIYFVFTSINSIAAFVTIETASQVAENFYKSQYYKMYGSIPAFKAKTINAKWYENQIIYYVCNFSHGGFVLVSSNDNAYPIIGFSFEDNFPEDINEPPSFEFWMQNVKSEMIEATLKTGKSEHSIMWNQLLDDNSSVLFNKSDYKAVLPLLTLRWDQGVPYNLQCPVNSQGPGGHCLTGCVATAMAQVMKYWNYPERGRDSILYTGNNNLNFENTYYKWTAMTNQAYSSSHDTIKNAIAELMFHCGVTVNMMYGATGSATFTELVPDALVHYFRYHPGIGFLNRQHIPDDEWDFMIRDNLDNGMPVIYSGSGTGGHAFVCDGYSEPSFYHFNWGWSGAYNGYFYNNDLTPGSNNFSIGQGAVFNIMPYFAPYCRSSRVLTDIYRTFSDGSMNSYYWNNTNCDWLISLPDPYAKITLNFTSFSTEANADFVYVYDGSDTTAPLLGKYSGSQLPPTIVSSAGNLYIVFTSNGSVQAQGWDAVYEARYCKDGNVLNNSYGTFTDGSDTALCWNNSKCEWLISPPNQNEKIKLIFSSFSTEQGNDFVSVFDGEDSLTTCLGKFSGNQIPDTLMSSGSKLYIVFTTSKNVRSEGWVAKYYSGNISVPEITSNKYFEIYPNPVNDKIFFNTDQDWSGVVDIYTITGDLVYTLNLDVRNAKPESVSLTSLPKGMYFLKAKNSDGEIIKRFIKE